MVETSKQVRVDNWGVFFLSRLQVFFNKTDYCDLTLQFEGNVQLKVHRLVMNACTEYFQLLEQTCEVIDDVLLMPPDLQADVILPIVNFMYTGMLEFQMSMFDKLYKTAELMNIPVLLRLLDAQKHPQQNSKAIVSKVNANSNNDSKKLVNKTNKVMGNTPIPGRKLPVWKRKTIASSASSTSFLSERRGSPIDPLANYDNAPKPTRFEWPDEDFKTFNLLDTSFDSISYTSKPLLTQDEELKVAPSLDDSRCSSISSEDPKEYVVKHDKRTTRSYSKKHKMHEFSEDDVDNDLDDADYSPEAAKRKITQITPSSTKKLRLNNVTEKENKETRINITGKGELDHSKLISEVLKKYPHLVKKNKNIRLKILAKNKDTPTQSEPKVETKLQLIKKPIKKIQIKTDEEKPKLKPPTSVSEVSKASDEGPWVCEKCSVAGEPVEFVLYYLYRKHMSDMHNEKLDPTLCKFCGFKGNNTKIMNYHQYVKHGILPSPNYTFPQCEKCPFIALSEPIMTKHKLTHGVFDAQCNVCKVGFNSELSLKQHIKITGHSNKISQSFYDCQYCTKQYQTSTILFSHIKTAHQEEARRDGIVSIDEESEIIGDTLKIEDQNVNKVKVLSNVKLQKPSVREEVQQTVPIIPQTTQALTSVANNIATSLGLVDIVVLDDNQQYILHSSNNQEMQDSMNRNQEFILPELPEGHSFVQTPSMNQVITSEHNVITQSMLTGNDIGSTDELVMVLTDHDYNNENNQILNNDNSNIVVLYSHPVEGQENQFITSQGNLILNSETGMLELQNGNISNTETVVTQANVGESIEMIQQEINNHNSKNDLHLVTTTASMVSHSEELQDAIQAPESGNPETLGELKAEHDETDGFVAENSETIQNEGEELQTDTIDSTEPEPMEIGEVTSTQEHSNDLVEENKPAPHESVVKTQETYEENEGEESAHDTSENNHDVVTDFLKSPTNNSTTSEAQALSDPPVEEAEIMERLENRDESVLQEENLDESLEKEKNLADTTEAEYVEEAMEVDSGIKSQENNEASDQVDNTKAGDDSETDFSIGIEQDTPGEILIEKDKNETSDDKINEEQQNIRSVNDEDSQISVGKDSKEDSSEPSKISILADWDDTDSQQSDFTNKPTNDANAVNKLINDWDDD